MRIRKSPQFILHIPSKIQFDAWFPDHPDNLPDRLGNFPGHSGNSPDHLGNHPGHPGNFPDRLGNHPNRPGNSPDRLDNYPGHSGNSPDRLGNHPGHPDNFPNHLGIPATGLYFTEKSWAPMSLYNMAKDFSSNPAENILVKYRRP
jgi:hypothetical protein